jgi:hypothetical protein
MEPKVWFVIGMIPDMKWNILTEALPSFEEALKLYEENQWKHLYYKLKIVETVYG